MLVYNLNMTVILAALYEDGKGAIIMSDKMRTTGYDNGKGGISYHYEENEDIQKIFRINKHSTLAYAGDVEFWTNVIDELRMQVNQNEKCSKVRTKLETIYRNEMRDWLATNVLFLYGYARYDDYVNDQQRLRNVDPMLINIIENRLNHERQAVPGELLLVGKDDNKTMKLFTLAATGKLNLSARGLATLGSGAKHSMVTMLKELRLSQSQDEVYEILKKAKKLSEVEQDVGAATEEKTVQLSDK